MIHTYLLCLFLLFCSYNIHYTYYFKKRHWNRHRKRHIEKSFPTSFSISIPVSFAVSLSKSFLVLFPITGFSIGMVNEENSFRVLENWRHHLLSEWKYFRRFRNRFSSSNSLFWLLFRFWLIVVNPSFVHR